MTVNLFRSPAPNQQPLFQALFSQSQPGPLDPDLTQPFVNTGPTVPEPQRDLRWQDVLSGPAPAGPQFAAMGELDFCFMQAVFLGSPNITDTELQQFAADNNVNAASLADTIFNLYLYNICPKTAAMHPVSAASGVTEQALLSVCFI